MFSKILIANRGEIAVRIIRAGKEMGIATVAVYSQADEGALHVALADESYCIGPAPSEESYLHQHRIITAAQLSGAQAIHPGYGFLSENAHFAGLCQRNGLVFISPQPRRMEALGDKAALKRCAQAAGLAVIPGTDTLESFQSALDAAQRIGYPAMLKARSGGGGRGIRLVRTPEELESAYPQAVAEAEAAFGDGAVYLEKYIAPARHIEVQILADEAGHVVCLGERDCSVQRRHQKLIEETPSPAVSAQQRQALMESCAQAARALGYVGAGTMEFLLDGAGNFYFMEMNVRMQVEHCVTEMLTRIDLVKWQIRVAAGIPLSFTQADVRMDAAPVVSDEDEAERSCTNCRKSYTLSVLWERQLTCLCGYHFRMQARQRIHFLTDRLSFHELFAQTQSGDPLHFPGYAAKLEIMRSASGEPEAVVCGTAAIEGMRCCLFVMESY